MNILLAPDSFKGTLSADEVCDIIESVLEKEIPNCNITKLPVADGGEGLCLGFAKVKDGEWHSSSAVDPFGEPMKSDWLMLENGVAVIEMSACAGLPLVADRADPTKTTTFGVGMMIADAVKNGAKGIILGLGGSATNDCGAGMAAALGFSFLDVSGESFLPAGGTLENIAKIVPPTKPFPIPVTAACDVKNPLFGRNGAAYVYAPQKGADEKQVKLLDYGLRHISELLKRDLGADVTTLHGAGAAGGLGAGAVAFLNAELQSGIDIFLDVADFDSLAVASDLVITGEGRLDCQSLCGKVISGICARTERLGVKTAAVCGCVSPDLDIEHLGLSFAVAASNGDKTLNELKKTCRAELRSAAVELAVKISEIKR